MIELLIKLAIVVFTAYNNMDEAAHSAPPPTAEERIIALEKQIAELQAAPK